MTRPIFTPFSANTAMPATKIACSENNGFSRRGRLRFRVRGSASYRKRMHGEPYRDDTRTRLMEILKSDPLMEELANQMIASSGPNDPEHVRKWKPSLPKCAANCCNASNPRRATYSSEPTRRNETDSARSHSPGEFSPGANPCRRAEQHRQRVRGGSIPQVCRTGLANGFSLFARSRRTVPRFASSFYLRIQARRFAFLFPSIVHRAS